MKSVTPGSARASARAKTANASWSSDESGVVRLPKFITEMKTRTPSSCAAATTLRSAFRSSAVGAVCPGAQTCVIRIASSPASRARSSSAFALTGSTCLTTSSAAPISMAGPPACAGAAEPTKASATSSSLRTKCKVAMATLGPVEDRVKNLLKSLPAKPGVYLFRDTAGAVLYIGKAKSLRPRIRSYFQRGGDGRMGIAQMVARVADVEVIVTGNEVEALHLEQNLVKRHRPPFNVRLRDDKSFPYIAVTVEDEFPRVMFTRERHRRRARAFRPHDNPHKGGRAAP